MQREEITWLHYHNVGITFENKSIKYWFMNHTIRILNNSLEKENIISIYIY